MDKSEEYVNNNGIAKSINGLAVGNNFGDVNQFHNHYYYQKNSSEPLDIVPTDRSQLPPVIARLPKGSLWPHRRSLGKRFVGRLSILWELHDKLTQTNTTVIHGVIILKGTGGLGKTQLAIEYVYRFGSYYEGGIFWIDAEQSIDNMISKLAAVLDIALDHKSTISEQLNIIWAKLSERKESLLVLDNFPESHQENTKIASWIPVSGCIHILVTTRSAALTNYENISLNVLSPEASFDLLNSGTVNLEHYKDTALQLAYEVGYLPLALELLRNYLENNKGYPITNLLADIKNTNTVEIIDGFGEDYHEDTLPSGHIKSIIKTFELSWNKVSEESKPILQIMSCLAPLPVPKYIIRKVLRLEEGNRLKDPLIKRIKKLYNFSLVDLDINEENPFAHRLILGYVRHYQTLDHDLLQKTSEAISIEMNRAMDVHDIESLKDLELVYPHAENFLQKETISNTKKIKLTLTIGKHHYNHGRYNRAYEMQNEALYLSKTIYPKAHPLIITAQNDVSITLMAKGKIEEAINLSREVLEIYEINFPEEEESINIFRSNLASQLKVAGKFKEALELSKRAYIYAKKHFTASDPRLTIRLSNLGRELMDSGNLQEACRFMREALCIEEQNFPPLHPNIATRQANLAVILMNLGELEEAKLLLQKALISDKHNFSDGHPNIIKSQYNLAKVLMDLHEFNEAFVLLKNSLYLAQKHYEPGHYEIVTCQYFLALALENLGKLEDAETLLQESVNLCGKIFAQGHFEVIVHQSQLIIVLYKLGKAQEAQEILDKVLINIEQHSESKTLVIISCLNNIALLIYNLGYEKRAKNLLWKVLTLYESMFNSGNHDINKAGYNLALVFYRCRELQAAVNLLQKALASEEQNTNPNQQLIIGCQDNIALILNESENFIKAKKIVREMLAYTKQNVASNIDHELEKSDEALDFYQKIFNYSKENNLFEKFEVQICMHNWTYILTKIGKFEEAKTIIHVALKFEQQNSIINHSSMSNYLKNMADIYFSLNDIKACKEFLINALEHENQNSLKDYSRIKLMKYNIQSMSNYQDLLNKT
ncbi:MAG: tetratricopeptide repeat protein [Pseudomonadota bacterium]